MGSHPELDQLSAYIDDELNALERAALDAHLPTCAECRTTLDALQETIADLGTLPDVAPTEQESWALRAAIAKARTPAKRWHRAAWAAGAVAAAAIAVVAVVRPGAEHNLASGSQGEGAAGALASPLIQYDAGSFTAASAQRRLLVLSGRATEGQVTTVPSAEPPAGSAFATNHRTATSPTALAVAPQGETAADASTDIDRCVRVIQRSTEVYLSPVEYDVGAFEGKPAFLLFFRAPQRYELWVVDRTKSCNTLYFAQAA